MPALPEQGLPYSDEELGGTGRCEAWGWEFQLRKGREDLETLGAKSMHVTTTSNPDTGTECTQRSTTH